MKTKEILYYAASLCIKNAKRSVSQKVFKVKKYMRKNFKGIFMEVSAFLVASWLLIAILSFILSLFGISGADLYR